MDKKVMNKKFFLPLIFSMIPTVFAGDLVTGKIIGVTVIGDTALIQTDPDPANRPACSINQTWDYAFSVAGDGGQATLSMALTAYTTQSVVTVRALDSCLVNHNTDDIDYLVLRQ